jgi:hypothetical protein
METEGISVLQSGVWLIPLFLVATLAILFLLVRRWQKQSQVDLRALRSDLRQLHANHRDLTLMLQGHSPDDPEPYGSRVKQLQAKLDEFNQFVKQIEEQDIALQEQAHWLKQGSFQTVAGAPYFWYQLRQNIHRLWGQIEQAWQRLGSVAELAQSIDRLGWEVALKARQVNQIQQQTNQIMDILRARGIRGQTIEAATHQEKQSRTALGQVPVFFLEGDEEAVLGQADKDTTTTTHDVLENARLALQNLLAQAMGWDQQYVRAHEQFTAMQQSLHSLEETLNHAPNELNIAHRRAQLSQIKTTAQDLHDRLSQPEVEHLDGILQEAAQVTHETQQAESELKQAYESASRLDKELAELSAGLKQISLIIAGLETKAHHPVVWGAAANRLADLNRQNAAIGPAKKPRDPAQVIRDLERAVRLNEQQRELGLNLRQVEEQHAELTQILESPEISQIQPWLQSAQQLADKVKDYAAENWPRVDAVSELPAELQSMANDVLRVMPPGAAPAIPEAELPGRLEDARRLLQAYHRLEKRVENIRNQLANLQKDEKQAQEQLANAQVTVNQVQLIVGSNPFLTQIAGKEIERFQHDLQGVLDDLAQRQHGSLDKKVKNGLAALGKIEQTANRWLDQLNQDTYQQVQALTKMLNALDAIAPLEEQHINDARRLLSSGQALGGGLNPLGGIYASKSKFHIEQLTPEFKRRSDFWQLCAGVSREMQEDGKPVLDSYEQADANRQQAHELLTQSAAWLRQAREWPPTSATLDTERQEMDRIDGQWQTLKSNPTRAIQLVQQLEQISARYHDLAVHIQQTTENAEKEMVAVNQLENEITDLQQRWQNTWRSYQDTLEVVQDIRHLLDEADREIGTIRRQYKQKARNYSQVFQSLKGLERKLRYYQVALDENRALDMDGNEKRRR